MEEKKIQLTLTEAIDLEGEELESRIAPEDIFIPPNPI